MASVEDAEHELPGHGAKEAKAEILPCGLCGMLFLSKHVSSFGTGTVIREIKSSAFL